MKRLQSFLPAMQESNRVMNEEISNGNASKYNLEADDDSNGEIENENRDEDEK